jgi:AcrR family transcriptional regulator
MEQLPIYIQIDERFYTKNPESSALGKKIVSHSISMIEEIGFESFTFKKLGQEIGSNESSVYRYFESKHMLLVYLICWYWSWVSYRIVFKTVNIDKPQERLQKAIAIITSTVTEDQSFSYINEILLQKIIISESAKAYHTKEIDEENAKGYFTTYKNVVQRVSEMVLAVNTSYKYPHMLISTVIEGSHQQRYFSEHLPSLTDIEIDQDTVVQFYTNLVLQTIDPS